MAVIVPCDLEPVFKVIWVLVASCLKWITWVNTEILFFIKHYHIASFLDEKFSFTLWLFLSLLTTFSNRIFLELQTVTARREIRNGKKNVSTVNGYSNTKVLTKVRKGTSKSPCCLWSLFSVCCVLSREKISYCPRYYKPFIHLKIAVS